jgi:acetaldehyde dehydrogenase (acetylating)
MSTFPVAILGSGNIGTDLLVKCRRSELLKCVAFVGRSFTSAGMVKAQSLGVTCSDRSIAFIQEHPRDIKLVFDATSAKDHLVHAPILKNLGITVVDLTPAHIGPMCVPGVNMDSMMNEVNLNMVTCGGQASIPIAYAIGQTQGSVEYIEVISSIASRSAGPATRANLDEYIGTTEAGVKHFSGAAYAKAILNLNPAIPCIDMQTTIFAKVSRPDITALTQAVSTMVAKISSYVPGYQLLVAPKLDGGRIVVMVKVRGLGDYLPEYAGNLDIINCAAIAIAEEHARKSSQGAVQ